MGDEEFSLTFQADDSMAQVSRRRRGRPPRRQSSYFSLINNGVCETNNVDKISSLCDNSNQPEVINGPPIVNLDKNQNFSMHLRRISNGLESRGSRSNSPEFA